MMKRLDWKLAAAALALAAAGCSQPGEANEGAETAKVEAPAPAPAANAEPAEPAAVPEPAPKAAGSRVLGKRDFTKRGKANCEVRFVYAGREEENLFWEEPCKAVTAKLMSRRELASLGKWDRLDEFAQKYVAALPGGQVLYVEGSFSASVYPVNTTGSTYEVSVAD